MAAKRYTLASPEGVDFYRLREQVEAEVGENVQLELDAEQELALLAAGWLALPGKAKEDK